MATYVISDIHGYYDELIAMLKLIKFSKNDELYILGDCIDKGPKSLDVIKFLMINTDRIHLLKGNHEDMFVKGFETAIGMINYQEECGDTFFNELMNEKDYIIEEIVNFINNAPYYDIFSLKNKNFLLSHAGVKHFIPSKEGYIEDLKEINNNDFIYGRKLDAEIIDKNLIQVMGHNPIQMYDDYVINNHSSIFNKSKNRKAIKNGNIVFGKNKIFIDTGLGHNYDTSKLSCLRLDDYQTFYIDIIEKDIEFNEEVLENQEKSLENKDSKKDNNSQENNIKIL